MVSVRGIICKSRSILAELFLVSLARGAMSTGIYHTSHSGKVSDLEFCHILSDFRHAAGYFMPRHNRISGM